MSCIYRIVNLYSGSEGNATYISAGDAHILIDAGKSARALCLSLKSIGVDIDRIDAIFLTHEHRDHTSALVTLAKKHPIPVHTTRRSAPRVCADETAPLFANLRVHPPVFTEHIAGLEITSFPTPHDSRESVGYRLSFTDAAGMFHEIGYTTDIGCVNTSVREGLRGCESVVLESNHDPEMLWGGSYPPDLKERIYSRFGHLSNPDCAAFAAELAAAGTRNFLLAHLSRENNLPELAFNETWAALADESVRLLVASPDFPVSMEVNYPDNTPEAADTAGQKEESYPC